MFARLGSRGGKKIQGPGKKGSVSESDNGRFKDTQEEGDTVARGGLAASHLAYSAAFGSCSVINKEGEKNHRRERIILAAEH